MPKAEVGSTKWLGNKMKAKGLQRLRWYCQPCEKQTRDENGFKQHCLSESHVRNMLLVGEDSRGAIKNFSNQFKHDFVQLLKTAHNEKPVHANNFYQTYIAHKEHVHMNSTDWPSLTEFVKYLGREGIVRVSETDKGLFIAWIDDSPEALRRRDAVKRKERQDRGDEEREQRMIREQIERAQGKPNAIGAQSPADEPQVLERKDGQKIVLNLFGEKASPPVVAPEPVKTAASPSPPLSPAPKFAMSQTKGSPVVLCSPVVSATKPAPIAAGSRPKNVFAVTKKNKSSSGSKPVILEPSKKMSNAALIMMEEQARAERKRKPRDDGGTGKKMRFD